MDLKGWVLGFLGLAMIIGSIFLAISFWRWWVALGWRERGRAFAKGWFDEVEERARVQPVAAVSAPPGDVEPRPQFTITGRRIR